MITKQHFAALERLIHEQGLPVLQQQQQQQQQRSTHGQPSSRVRTSSYNQNPPSTYNQASHNYNYNAASAMY